MIKFEIVDIVLEDTSFHKFPVRRRTKQLFAFLLKPTNYNPTNSTEGIFMFMFYLETIQTDRIVLTGKCTVMSDNQMEIENTLKKNKKLLNKFLEKVLYNCLLKSKMVFDEEGLPFPKIELMLEMIEGLKNEKKR